MHNDNICNFKIKLRHKRFHIYLINKCKSFDHEIDRQHFKVYSFVLG